MKMMREKSEINFAFLKMLTTLFWDLTRKETLNLMIEIPTSLPKTEKNCQPSLITPMLLKEIVFSQRDPF